MDKCIYNVARRYMILPVVVFVSSLVFASEVEFKNIRYVVDEDLKTAEVAPTPKASGNIVIPDEINAKGDKFRVVAIGEKAFKGCKGLKKITIPATVERIGRNAFEGSGLLKDKANWKKGAVVVDGCLLATNNEITSKFVYKGKEPLRLIAEGAFAGNKTLKTFIMPENMKEVPFEAFCGCAVLTSVVIPDSAVEIGDRAFFGCILLKSADLPKGLKRIGDGAFDGCAKLAAVELPKTLDSIGVRAFAGCARIKTITLPAGLTEIKDGLFDGCTALDGIVLPAGVTRIGNEAFRNCQRFRSITLPEGLKEIGDRAFYGCTNLKTVEWNEALRLIGKEAFYGCKNLYVPVFSGRVGVEKNAFKGCVF